MENSMVIDGMILRLRLRLFISASLEVRREFIAEIGSIGMGTFGGSYELIGGHGDSLFFFEIDPKKETEFFDFLQKFCARKGISFSFKE